MAGNVWEWTRSIDGKYPYVADDGREEAANVTSDSLMRVRGGSWYNDADALRCALRYGNDPYYGDDGLGFRVCVRPHFPAPSEL
ncbi:MAG: SUMF1/EgtB/PvdO family nonheme iron enzyme [Chloroflexi bacterium]|nr:SUMF1/EgtB/PvdO family nonheme iron enzyme [Chloroflexota bacterium]